MGVGDATTFNDVFWDIKLPLCCIYVAFYVWLLLYSGGFRTFGVILSTFDIYPSYLCSYVTSHHHIYGINYTCRPQASDACLFYWQESLAVC